MEPGSIGAGFFVVLSLRFQVTGKEKAGHSAPLSIVFYFLALLCSRCSLVVLDLLDEAREQVVAVLRARRCFRVVLY